jgi:RNA polymerase sigma factor (sigma-70 family)
MVSGLARRVREPMGEHFEQILAAAQAGAGWAAERLWTSLAPAVAGYLRVQGADEPDDLTSEVFIGVFRNLSSFSGTEEQLRSWVFTIAHRRLMDERRRAARRPQLSPLAAAESGEPAGHDAGHEALRRLGSEQVRSICERLVPDQRDVLLLRLLGGLTVDEVAAALGKSPGAVKALQRRALGAVRKIFDLEGVPF